MIHRCRISDGATSIAIAELVTGRCLGASANIRHPRQCQGRSAPRLGKSPVSKCSDFTAPEHSRSWIGAVRNDDAVGNHCAFGCVVCGAVLDGAAPEGVASPFFFFFFFSFFFGEVFSAGAACSLGCWAFASDAVNAVAGTARPSEGRQLLLPVFGIFGLRLVDSHPSPCEAPQLFQLARTTKDQVAHNQVIRMHVADDRSSGTRSQRAAKRIGIDERLRRRKGGWAHAPQSRKCRRCAAPRRADRAS